MGDIAIVLAVVIAAFGVGFAMSRVSKIRKELPELAEQSRKPKRQSKREKRLEAIRAAEPEWEPPSIEDLVAAEIEETGVDRIPGGEGLPTAVLLKVFRRDTTTAETCAPEDRRFVLAAGVHAADAGVDDVRLVCETHTASSEATAEDGEVPPN
jgi:hypothetical protein